MKTFLDQFTPINRKSEHFDESGYCETFGTDANFVSDVFRKTPNRVWTVVDDEDQLIVLNGVHFVNRLYFIVTEEHGEGDDCFLLDEKPPAFHCVAYLKHIDLVPFSDFFSLEPMEQFEIIRNYYLPERNPKSVHETYFHKPWKKIPVVETEIVGDGGIYILATNRDFSFACLLWRETP